MSRIGKMPIKLPEGVSFKVEGNEVIVNGSKGTLKLKVPFELDIEVKKDHVLVVPKRKGQKTKALHGTFRALIANHVTGVMDGWSKTLELVGTGYRAELAGNKLVLTVGYSHPVEIEIPEGIEFKVEKTQVEVSGINKEKVGQVAAEIRAIRPPEPYKGKGIKYKDEVIRRKPGKAAKTQGVAV